MKELRKKLGIDEWLDLVKEDKNLNGAYISFAQYMYLLEQEVDALNQTHDYDIQMIDEVKGNSVELFQENKQLKEQLLEETKNNYKLQDELSKKTKEYQETYKDVREEIKDYKKQLNQRDKVINKAIEFLTGILDRKSFVYGDLRKVVDKLQKCQGDNNE